jgi:hypothetical protein
MTSAHEDELPLAVRQRLQDYEQWFRRLTDFYLRARLKALGKTQPDEEDLKASVAKTSATLMAKASGKLSPAASDLSAALAEIEAGNFLTAESFLHAN